MLSRMQGQDRFEGLIGSTHIEVAVGSTGRRLLVLVSVVALALLLLGLTGCGSSPARTDPFDDAKSERILGHGGGHGLDLGESIARVALQMRGVPYLWGGVTPAGFDCSGLVYYSYAKAGIRVPRTSRAQYAAATTISPEQARPGDLLFFVNRGNWHVGISLGGERFVHAPQTGRLVSISSLGQGRYRKNLLAVGRLTPRPGGSIQPRRAKAADMAGAAKMTPEPLELSQRRTRVAQMKQQIGLLR